MAKETQLLNIGSQLRFVLFGLECILNVEFDPAEVERAFSDAASDATEVRYAFWSGQGLEVTGYVEDYEPGSLWLTVKSRRGYEPSLSAIVERAQYQALRYDSRDWYSVKCIFEHPGQAQEAERTVYEERIVILHAASLDDAIDQGEAEARQYAGAVGDGSIHYVGFIDAYYMVEKGLANKTEVYSLLRGTSLSLEGYLTHYYDDGSERTQIYRDMSEAE